MNQAGDGEQRQCRFGLKGNVDPRTTGLEVCECINGSKVRQPPPYSLLLQLLVLHSKFGLCCNLSCGSATFASIAFASAAVFLVRFLLSMSSVRICIRISFVLQFESRLGCTCRLAFEISHVLHSNSTFAIDLNLDCAPFRISVMLVLHFKLHS